MLSYHLSCWQYESVANMIGVLDVFSRFPGASLGLKLELLALMADKTE